MAHALLWSPELPACLDGFPAVLKNVVEKLKVVACKLIASLFRLALWKWRFAAHPFLHVLTPPQRTKNAAQACRLLAIAAVFDGASREEAAKIGRMDRQTLRDWVIRFNERGRTVSSAFHHQARRPSSTRGTKPFSPGLWKMARSRRSTVWCAGEPAI